jgi:serine/threonine protein kinase
MGLIPTAIDAISGICVDRPLAADTRFTLGHSVFFHETAATAVPRRYNAHVLSPDQQLGPYRLIDRVGAGGMGEVWRAEDSRLGRIVAIKVLPPSFVADAEATSRLKREARTAAQLYHPSIATIHSIEQDGDHIFIVEEFVEGESLTKVIKRGGLAEQEICRIVRAVADALAEAHAKGIVHRDIKPDNIIVNGNRVKVLDFGIAKQVGVANAAPETFVTQQGMILGTIHYMSPEQALGKTLDGRTDVFSLGVVLYEMTTGRKPFEGETITETMTQIIRDEPRDAAAVNPNVSPGMKAIIDRSLRKNPAERFTAAEMVAALDDQIGRARTTPYTSEQANMPTVAAAAIAGTAIGATAAGAAPTIRTGPQVQTQAQTVQQPAQPRKRSALPAVLIVLVIVIAAAAAAVVAMRKSGSTPATTQTTTTTKSVAPPSSTSVSVTAPPDSTIDETSTATESTEATSTAPLTKVGSQKTATQEPAPATDTEPPPAPEPAPSSQEAAPGTDALYANAMAQIAGGDATEARKTLHRVLQQDPHYAKAHFRMGEIALLNRNLDFASKELQKALDDSDHLGAREEQLTHLGVAIASHDRQEIRRLSAEIWQRWPRDPDLVRMRETFPGMFGENGDRGSELPRGGRARRWQRP